MPIDYAHDIDTSGGDRPANRVTWDKPGDGITGVVFFAKVARFTKDNGDVTTCPELWIQAADGAQWQATCGPYELKALIAKYNVQEGDMVAITVTGVEHRQGKTFKSFRVAAQKPGGPVNDSAAGAPAPAPASVPQPAPAFAPVAPMPPQAPTTAPAFPLRPAAQAPAPYDPRHDLPPFGQGPVGPAPAPAPAEETNPFAGFQ